MVKMVKMWWILPVYFIAFRCSESTSVPDTLRFVHVVWRHGDRTPIRVFPTDTKNGPETWPEGLGELTTTGMLQQYELGSFLRRRYIDTKFLSPEYNSSEIYIRSTDYNRTINSALANLAAFYPPSIHSQFKQGLIWRPIPVHSVSLMLDYVAWTDRLCPKFNKIVEELAETEPIEKLERQNSDFVRFLINATGLKLTSFAQIGQVFDVLFCEKVHNRTWPAWVTPEIFDKVKRLYEVALIAGSDNSTLQRFRGGPLFREIAQRSLAKASASKTLQPAGLKYYAYSAHDSTVVALLKALGSYDGHIPDYAVALMIELHEPTNGKFVIKVLHLNETGSENLVPISIKGCGISCDLSTFVNLSLSNSPSDWYTECGLPDPERERDTNRFPSTTDKL